MFRRILVPLDGSELSERALLLAVPLARRANARLLLVSVHAAFPAGGESDAARQAHLHSLVQTLQTRGIAADAALLHHDAPVQLRTAPGAALVGATLRHHAHAHGIDLIVMTTHGRGHVRRAWLGSVADALVRSSDIPVLLSRPGHKAPQLQPFLHTVLVPVDGSPTAEEALGPAIAFARLGRRHITFVHVVEPPASPFNPYNEWALTSATSTFRRSRDDAEAYVAGLADTVRARDLTVETDVITDGTMPGILAAVRRHRPAVIALATHGAGGVRRLLLGSVADKLIRSAAVPVLVVRPGPLSMPEPLELDYMEMPTRLTHEPLDGS